jgi:hypothetical protein
MLIDRGTKSKRFLSAALLAISLGALPAALANGSELRMTAQFMETGSPAASMLFVGEIADDGSVTGSFLLLHGWGASHVLEGTMTGYIDEESGVLILDDIVDLWLFGYPDMHVLIKFIGDYFLVDLETGDAEAVGWRSGHAKVIIRD